MNHEEEKAARRENERQLAENERDLARLTGKMEATYENLPRDEALIAASVKATGASREKVVGILEGIAERELAALRDGTPAPRPDATVNPAVRRFREMLG